MNLPHVFDRCLLSESRFERQREELEGAYKDSVTELIRIACPQDKVFGVETHHPLRHSSDLYVRGYVAQMAVVEEESNSSVHSVDR